MTTVYDFPVADVPPARSRFIPGVEAVQGGYTVGGVTSISPTPGGGYASITYEFNAIGSVDGTRLVSWLSGALRDGRVFRVPLVRSRQLISATALGASESSDWLGTGYDPTAPANANAVEGTVTLEIDMTAYGQVLKKGHCFGINDAIHMADAVSYAGNIATVTVKPPLRFDVEIGALVHFRPRMTAICTAADTFAPLFDRSDVVVPGPITFTEVVVNG